MNAEGVAEESAMQTRWNALLGGVGCKTFPTEISEMNTHSPYPVIHCLGRWPDSLQP